MKTICAAALCFVLAGCASIGSTVEGVVVSATTAGPTQAKTLAEAVQAATLAEKVVDLYVKNANPSKTVLVQLQILLTAVHNSLQAAEAANANGNSALAASGLSAFNEALAAFQSYAANKGISQ